MAQFLKFIRKPVTAVFIGSFTVFLITVTLQKAGRLEFLELGAYDWFVRMEPKLVMVDHSITLIEISEKDIHSIGRWPLSDETVAKALKKLLSGNPRAIGLDIYRDILVPPGSAELKSVFDNNPQVIGVNTFGEKGVRSPAIIANPEQIGFNDILVDPGGIVRRALIFLDDGENVYNSFALRLASLYLQADGIALQSDPKNPQYVRIKSTTIKPFEANDGGYINADARGYQFLLDFEDAALPFRKYSLSTLLSGEVPSDAISNRIVLIGVGAESVKDYFYTPLSLGFDEAQQISGVDLHGHIVSQLLRFARDRAVPVSVMPAKYRIAWLLFWSLAGGLIALRARTAWRFSLSLAGALLVLFSIAYCAFLTRTWIPLVPPALSLFTSSVVVTALMSSREKKERALLMQLFSRHVSKEIAEVIWEQRDHFMNNGRPRSQKMPVTVFFSDLRGFTAMSEKMDPQDLIDWLNTYMEAMTQLIMKHGGVIDDYAGDGIKANFGVPLPRTNEEEVSRDAVNAVSCALAMDREMQRLNGIWCEKGLPAMGSRVGIFTGIVVTGLLGSSQRLKYTTVGDTVNIAARLESYDKEVGKDAVCRILIGDATLHYLGNSFTTEKIGEVSLKGKDQKITVHRVLGEGNSSVQTI